MVLQVREHHVFPHRIFHISFCHDAGTLSWIALLLTAPAILGAILARRPERSAVAFLLVGTAVTFSPLLVSMLVFHKCGHRARNPRWVRWLQESGLLLSVRTTSSTTRATTTSTTASSTAGPTAPWAGSGSSAASSG